MNLFSEKKIRLGLQKRKYDTNKCIGDNTKAADRQSPNCIKNNSPSGSTLQCDAWLWDDMPYDHWTDNVRTQESIAHLVTKGTSNNDCHAVKERTRNVS